ncbi:MAG: acyl-ACP--UDP-N-acetylglucosamine O-acyltransferase [Candidatus Omnitrophota bacterium]|nr:MAG: acyl-ACP--UDP-N-acetylglucosamine O-acyltransferase [Candidatus Omnitrophota bacterium]
MATQIHPTAMVAKSSYLDENVIVGPYAIVGDNVKVGAGTVIDSFAQVLGYTQLGVNCRVFSSSIVGSIPQDLKYKEERSYLIIGDNNRIREFVTINPGTEKDSKTVIGSDNLLMAYSHVAHDCYIGDGNILANGTTLAGYVTIEDKVVVGGLVAVHQFCRLGNFSIVGGCSKVVQDIPPYSVCDGHPAVIYGVNLVGLRRAKFSAPAIKNLKEAFKILFFQNHPLSKAKDILRQSCPSSREIEYLLNFISTSKRGIRRHRSKNEPG